MRSIALERSAGDASAALAIAEAAAKSLPADPAIQAELAQAQALAATSGTTDLSKLANTLAANDPNRALKAQALSLLADYQKTGKATPELARVMAKLAEAFPLQFDLQQRAYRLCAELNLNDLSATIARRTAERLAGSVDAQQFAALAFARLGQTSSARQYATRWKNLLGGASTEAVDLLLADLALRDNRTAEAMQLLAPHRDDILRAPNDHGLGVYTLGVVLARARRRRGDRAARAQTRRLQGRPLRVGGARSAAQHCRRSDQALATSARIDARLG
ncbi:MAG: hypothetical protein QM770_05555 [Tepidisphaeraceae bacterium]